MKKILMMSIILIMFVTACVQQETDNVAEQDNTVNVDAQVEVDIENVPSSDLADHNIQDDCWIGYEGNVYDVTLFLPKHPGSAEAIIPFCGTSDEFAEAFEGQHGKFKVEKLLQESMFIGTLE